MRAKKTFRENLADVSMSLYGGYFGYLMLTQLWSSWRLFLLRAAIGLGVLGLWLYLIYLVSHRKNTV